eukprot:TRINITY_DN37144_c0_g1_i1.p1 TRINITY_DN37144_c0_g1~~TRINITY_DN37144_c0_g1_i1.p1  ORF type:complete len:981 (-),score=186.91 TRINITY_DN37144_c0_g1_i1:40-2982(-)
MEPESPPSPADRGDDDRLTCCPAFKMDWQATPTDPPELQAPVHEINKQKEDPEPASEVPAPVVLSGTPHNFDDDPIPDIKLKDLPGMRAKEGACPPLEDPGRLPFVDKSAIVSTVVMLVFMVLILQGVLWLEWVKMAEESLETPTNQSILSLNIQGLEISQKVTKWSRWAVQWTVGTANIQLVPGLGNYSSVDCGAYSCTGYTSNIVYNSTNMCNTVKYLLGLLNIIDNVPFVGIGFEDGTFLDATRSSSTGELTTHVRDAQDVLGKGTDYIEYGVDSSTGCYNLNDQRSSSTYDPRSRSWYIVAKADAPSSGWGNGTYAVFSTGKLVISATQPLYGVDNTTGAITSTFIGVVLADCELDDISTELSHLQPGKTGQTYITEYVDGEEYMVGASTGNVLVDDARTTPSASNSSVIRNSYAWLKQRYSVDGAAGGTQLDNQTVEASGDIFSGDSAPVLGMQKYTDQTTGTLDWRCVCTFPASDYSDFVLTNMIVTGLMSCVTIYCLVILLKLARKFHRQEKIITEKIATKLEDSIMKQVICCTAIGAVLWVLWLVYTKIETDSAVEAALDDFQSGLAKNLTWRWEAYPLVNNATIRDYLDGFLPLGEDDAVDGDSGKLIDAHTANQVDVSRTMASVFVGFPNGDITGVFYYCRVYASKCDDQWYKASMFRSEVTTDRKYTEYNLTQDASTTSYVKDTSALISSGSVYDATARPWYKAAVGSGRLYTGSYYGAPVVSSVYSFDTTILVTIAQAYYNTTGTSDAPVFVAAVDVDFSYLSDLMAETVPSSDSQSAIVQNVGELTAASDRTVQLTDSDGTNIRMNVSNTAMKRIRAYANSLFAENDYEYVPGQNTSNLHGDFVQAAAPTSNYDTPYTFLANKLNSWTYLQAFEREVYYEDLDAGTERNFVIIVFAFTAILYISSTLVHFAIARIQGQQAELLESFNCELISEDEKLQLARERRAKEFAAALFGSCLLYTSPSPRDS